VTFADVLLQLESGLRRELPGSTAHALLSPQPRRAWPPGFNPARIRLAAGLLLVFPHSSSSDRAHIVLTVRAHALRHGGQVSLPGGVVDPGETFEQTALREAHEEIALTTHGVEVLGPLTPLDIPVSGFRLHPIVAAIDHAPRLHPADAEVARILRIDLDELCDGAALVATRRTRDGHTLDVPAFRVAGVEIWGATAMVLAEFLVLLGWHGPRPAPATA